MLKIDMLASFSVNKEESIEKAEEVFNDFLIEGEKILKAYTNIRDKVIFTDSKIICLDVKGITGTKKEFRFFPYSKINSFSVETAGIMDGDADFKIWASAVGMFEIKFKKGMDVKTIAILLNEKIG